MDPLELDSLVEQIEAEQASPRLAAQGHLVARGLSKFLQVHPLAAYAGLVDRFLASERA